MREFGGSGRTLNLAWSPFSDRMASPETGALLRSSASVCSVSSCSLAWIRLRRAVVIRERIEKLEKELTGMLGIPEPMTASRVLRRHRRLSKTGRARISAAAKARWQFPECEVERRSGVSAETVSKVLLPFALTLMLPRAQAPEGRHVYSIEQNNLSPSGASC